jgi:hypothetical protein
VPSVEIAFDAFIAVAIVSLLAIRRRHRINRTVEPVAVSVATGVVLGLVTALVGSLLIYLAMTALG